MPDRARRRGCYGGLWLNAVSKRSKPVARSGRRLGSARSVNTERNAQLRRLLLSPGALTPDAGFIRGLGQRFESLRNYKKDAEALRLAMEICCDPVELARYVPPYQRALSAITEASTLPE